MAIEAQEAEEAHTDLAAESETLIRCFGRLVDRVKCNSVLWAARPSGIRLQVRVRAGEYLEIVVGGPALASLSVLCPRCGTRWLPADPWHPLLGSSNGVLKPVTAAG